MTWILFHFVRRVKIADIIATYQSSGLTALGSGTISSSSSSHPSGFVADISGICGGSFSSLYSKKYSNFRIFFNSLEILEYKIKHTNHRV